MTLTWSRREFVGAGLSTTLIALSDRLSASPDVNAANLQLSETHPDSNFVFALIQSSPLQLEPSRAGADLERNTMRMLGVIERHGRCADWIAFDDSPLTGRAARAEAASPWLDEQLLDLSLARLAAAAQTTNCWLSFGAPRLSVGDSSIEEAVVAVSPSGETHLWPTTESRSQAPPIVATRQGRVALIPTHASAETIVHCREAGVDILLTMGSGPDVNPEARFSGLGIPLLQVQAASHWQEPGCPIDWAGRTRVIDATGRLIGACPDALERVLVVSWRGDQTGGRPGGIASAEAVRFERMNG